MVGMRAAFVLLMAVMALACRGGAAGDAGDAAALDATALDGPAADAPMDTAVADGPADAPVDAWADAPVDAPTDVAIDAPLDASPAACGEGTTFRVGPVGLTSLVTAMDGGGVLYAAFSLDAEPGFWLSATAVDGAVVVPPTHIVSAVTHPEAIAANRGRVFVAGSESLQVLSSAGVPLGPARPLPCPSPLGCTRNMSLTATPAGGFLAAWQHPSATGAGTSSAGGFDRDGMWLAPITQGLGVWAPIAMRSDGVGLTSSFQRANVGGCVWCSRAFLAEVSTDGTYTPVGLLPYTDGEGSGLGVSVTDDGVTTYVSWPLLFGGVNVAAWPGPTLLAIGGSAARIIATAPGTGAFFYRGSSGDMLLTRFRHTATIELSPATQVLAPQPPPPAIDGLAEPRAAFAADPDHVVVVEPGGAARCWTLPP